MILCPICSKNVRESNINQHIDSGCTDNVVLDVVEKDSSPVSSFFQPAPKPKQSSVSQPSKITSPNTPNGLKRPSPSDDSVVTQDAPLKKSKQASTPTTVPLAERMRPRSLDDISGQPIIAQGGVLRTLLSTGTLPSLLLWGGPGTGKTTIARLLASYLHSRFVEINSASAGVSDCKKIFADAKNEASLTGRRTVLFCDEIHRFSRAQQDVFLAPVEAGTITLIAATTENPSFKVLGALLSRCRVFTLEALSKEAIKQILQRAVTLSFPSSDPPALLLDPELHEYISTFASGDARQALGLLEFIIPFTSDPQTTVATVKQSLTKTFLFDRSGDSHYNAISALHKSLRGSDPDASLYWLARMLAGGEDPLFIARRLIVVASEDVGLADNTMLPLATATHDAVMKVGLPEARINLAHCVTALALAKKSTKSYRGYAAAEQAVRGDGTGQGLEVPVHLRNASTKLMSEMGYGAEYKYNPDYLNGKVKQDYLPSKLLGSKFLPDLDLGGKIDTDLE
jgi:putative ATPase